MKNLEGESVFYPNDKQKVVLGSWSGAASVSEEERDEWIAEVLNDVREKRKVKPEGMEYIMSGEAMVMVAWYENGMIEIFDVDVKRMGEAE